MRATEGKWQSRSALGAFKVQRHALAIDQHESGVDDLLASAVELCIAVQVGHIEDVFHGLAGGLHGGAEVDARELRRLFEAGEHGPDQVGDVFVDRKSTRLN